jgi:probable HAF family extracellular repeat protein
MHRICHFALASSAFITLFTTTETAAAASFKFESLSGNTSNVPTPLGVNKTNDVVGANYNYKTQKFSGFVWSGGSFKLIAGTKALASISDSGVAVGQSSHTTHSYVSYDIGTGVLADVPVPLAKGKTDVYGASINSAGHVAGYVFNMENGKQLGFLAKNGKIIELLAPHETRSQAVSINQSSEVIVTYGFAIVAESYLYSSGGYSHIYVPGSTATTAGFITNSGTIGGSFITSSYDTEGFILSQQSYKTFTAFGSTNTTVTGVGPEGQIVGTFVDSGSETHGFVYTNGTFYQIDIPNSTSTSISGIGASGAIFGSYSDSQGNYGYVGICPKTEVCTD